MHGDQDQIVTIDAFLEAKIFLLKIIIQLSQRYLKNCEHRIPTEGSSLEPPIYKKTFELLIFYCATYL